MDYVTLCGTATVPGSIANWLNHNFLSPVSPMIIQEAESAIYRRLRHFKMLTSTTGTMTSGSTNDFVTMPSDYLEDKAFFITGVNYSKLTRKTLQEVIASYCYDGSGNRVQTQPNIFFNDQTNLKFDSPFDQNYPFLLYYYQQPPALSTATATNFLTNTYPRLLRCACMTAAAEYMKDAGTGNYDRTYWEQMTEAEIDRAQAESDRSEHTIDVGMQLT